MCKCTNVCCGAILQLFKCKQCAVIKKGPKAQLKQTPDLHDGCIILTNKTSKTYQLSRKQRLDLLQLFNTDFILFKLSLCDLCLYLQRTAVSKRSITLRSLSVRIRPVRLELSTVNTPLSASVNVCVCVNS